MLWRPLFLIDDFGFVLKIIEISKVAYLIRACLEITILIEGYEVQLGGGLFGASDTQYSHTFTSLTASTCYDISIKAKFDCDPTHATTPAPATFSEVETINVCTQPAVCVISGVSSLSCQRIEYCFTIHLNFQNGMNHRV